MQEREALYCRRGGGRCAIVGIVFVVLLLRSSPGHPDDGFPAWIQARAGAAYPCEFTGGVCHLRENRYLSFIASFSNPHGLDDLLTSYITVGVHSPRHSVGVDWFAIYHPFYREDRTAIAFRFPFLMRDLHLAVKPSCEVQRISGFRSRFNHSFSVALFYGMTGPISIGMEGRWRGDALGEQPHTILKFSCCMRSLAIVINRVMSGPLHGDTRLGCEVPISGAFTVLTGYRLKTDEIYAGTFFRGDTFLLGFSWGHHPALGRTCTVGVGWSWLR